MVRPIEQDYLDLLNQFGLKITRFPESVEEAIETTQDYEIMETLYRLTPEKRAKVDDGLDYTGYMDFVKNIIISGFGCPEIIERMYCGEFPTEYFNALATPSKHGYLCLLNMGLRAFLFRISGVVCYWLNLISNDRNFNLEQILNENIIYVVALCHNFLKRKLGWQWTQLNGKYIIINNEDLKVIHGGISRAMRLFVVAHEFAHVQLDHYNNADKYVSATRVRDHVHDIEYLKLSYDQEFKADQFAQEVLISLLTKQGISVISGGVNFLIVANILSLVRCVIPDKEMEKDDKDTHPPEEERIKKLLDIIKSKVSNSEYKDVIKLSSLLTWLYDIIRNSEISLNIDGGIDIQINREYLKNTFLQMYNSLM